MKFKLCTMLCLVVLIDVMQTVAIDVENKVRDSKITCQNNELSNMECTIMR